MSVLSVFRVIAPEFDVETYTDEIVQANIDLYADMVSESKFGSFYERAVAFLTAHNMKLAQIYADLGNDGSELTSGAITSEREGDLQRSYGTDTDTSDIDFLLKKTVYGRQYLALMRMCVLPVTIRKRGI